MKTVIEMAREAGGGLESDYINISALERFAELVRADEREKLRDEMWDKAIKLVVEATKFEREACAKVCEDGVHNAKDWDSSYWDQCCNNRAAAIRARRTHD